jgi:hypothetical protein
MDSLLLATALTALAIGFGIFTAISLDNYEKENNKPHRFDVPLMLFILFLPFIVFIGTVYVYSTVS